MVITPPACLLRYMPAEGTVTLLSAEGDAGHRPFWQIHTVSQTSAVTGGRSAAQPLTLQLGASGDWWLPQQWSYTTACVGHDHNLASLEHSESMHKHAFAATTRGRPEPYTARSTACTALPTSPPHALLSKFRPVLALQHSRAPLRLMCGFYRILQDSTGSTVPQLQC